MGSIQSTAIEIRDTVVAHENPGRDYAAIKLTPPLVMAISLMYIIASDGHVDSAESSQIQSVVGQNDALVQFGSAYVRHVNLKEFLPRAGQGLSQRDKICILSNLCDAMLSDGVVRDIEHKTFELLLLAFGMDRKEFAKHYATLQTKNDKSVLGSFSLATAQTSMTPHLALVVAVLYMMSADGSIDMHEIGRLESLVAEFEGLQKLAVSYVKKTKREKFIQEAAYALNDKQKLFILLNVYDTMSTDGVIALTEDKIFDALMGAFGFSQSDMAWHVQVLEDKNLKPFDMRKASIDQLFESLVSEHPLHQAAGEHHTADSMGEVVARTMQDNVAHVSQNIGATSNVVQIQSNAIDDANLQKVQTAMSQTHREGLATESIHGRPTVVPSSLAISENRQTVDTDTTGQNLQELESASGAHNVSTIDSQPPRAHREVLTSVHSGDARAKLTSDGEQANRQRTQDAAFATNRQGLPVAVRIEHLSEDIEALYAQLSEFERRHQQWLNMGKIFQEQEAKNQQKQWLDNLSSHSTELPVQAPAPHRQTLHDAAPGVNRQKLQRDTPSDSGAGLRPPAEITSEAKSKLGGSENDVGASSEAHGAAHRAVLHVTFDTAGQPSDVVSLVRPKPVGHLHVRRASARKPGFFAHRGRVWAVAERAQRMDVKPWVLMLSLTVCVSNLGASKPESPKGVQGVLQRLQTPSETPEPSAPLLQGP